MFNKKCRRCGAELESEWRFCPFCGEKIESRWKSFWEFGVEDLLEKMFSITNEMFRELMGMEDDGKRKEAEVLPFRRDTSTHVVRIRITPEGVKIEGNAAGENKSANGTGSADREVSPLMKPRKNKKFSKVVEPKLLRFVKKKNGEIEVELEVEDIKKPEDIEILQLDESAEFRAYGKNKMYFKILEIPSSYELVENKIGDNTIYLKFVPKDSIAF